MISLNDDEIVIRIALNSPFIIVTERSISSKFAPIRNTVSHVYIRKKYLAVYEVPTSDYLLKVRGPSTKSTFSN